MQMSNSHLAWSLLPAGLQVLQGRPPAKKPPTRTDTKLPLLSLPPWETLVRGGGSRSSTSVQRTVQLHRNCCDGHDHPANLADF